MGRDGAGRIVIKLAVDDWVLEKLAMFDAEAAELEEEGDDEPDSDAEVDGAPVVRELVRPRVIRRRRAPVPRALTAWSTCSLRSGIGISGPPERQS